MDVLLTDQEGQQYSKLFVSRRDINFAQSCAYVLLKKGWHSKPWERRGTVYFQQAVYTSALVTSYGRVFTESKGWSRFPRKLLGVYSDEERTLHSQLLTLRNEVYAHSDSASYSIRPWRSENFSTDIVSAPILMMSAIDLQLFLGMTGRLTAAIDGRLQATILAASSRVAEMNPPDDGS